MTAYTFIPSQTNPFQFQPTLDGAVYNCVVTWNVAGQRYYLAGYTLAGVLAFYQPITPSPLGYDISLIKPFGFTSTLVYRDGTNQFQVLP